MFKLSNRIVNLRDELFAVESKSCFERAKIVTDSYKKSEGESMVIRRAKGFSDILTNMPIYIREDELLVGSRSSVLGWRTSYPEYSKNVDGSWPEEVANYWSGKTIGDLSAKLTPKPVNLANAELAACYVTGTDTGFGHMIVDYGKAVHGGFRAIIEEASAELKSAVDDPEGRDFLSAVIISCEGIITWANRYAELAEQIAKDASTSKLRRDELLTIAEVCRRVPEHPARNFHEALQAFWFSHIAMHIEQKGWSMSPGRFDQYMFKFYDHDLSAGISQEFLFELLLSLWVKFMENVDTKVKGTTFQNLTLGGQDMNGNCMSNALSHLCLAATDVTGFTQPALSARWHDNIAPDFREHIMRVISTGVGMPALFNDDIIIKALTCNGVSFEDALDYGLVGCVETSASGKMQGLTAGGHVNIAKAVELALFDGLSLTSGKYIGKRTGDAAKFTCFEDLFSAYAVQVRWLSGINITAAQIAGSVQKQLGYCPFTSSLLADCVKNRRDLVDGGTKYSISGVAIMGATNAVDSLMILKKLVFEEKQFTMEEVLTALRADFKGYDNMRQAFKNCKYRFGNDIEEADEFANRVYAVHSDFIGALPDQRGGHYTCGIWPVECHVYSGYHTSAAPDGRCTGDPLVDGVGACHGADKNGPTALLKSVAKLNNIEHWPSGNTCNIKFSRETVLKSSGLGKMASLFDTFMKLGGQQLQINVLDSATLHDAMVNPDEYENLVVRVAGFSAYFTTLNRDVQLEIISRMEQKV